MSMRRMIKGKNPDEIKELQKSDLERPVSNQDFEAGGAAFISFKTFLLLRPFNRS